MSTYTPDRWVILDIEQNGETLTRVFAGWYGGYTGSDSWKLSSGVTSIKETENTYEFTNESGSVYVCAKNAYGMTGYMGSVLAHWNNTITETAASMVISIDSKYAR